MLHPRANEIIDRLGLEPHPEGGYFREVYRSASQVHPDDERPPHAAVTAIYFLLAADQHSRWHRVGSDELWHFYEGSPLELLVGPPSFERVQSLLLGPPLGAGRAVREVPAGRWQAARTQGAYSLVGCTVAPGFELADFAFLRDHPEPLASLRRLSPELAALA